MNYGVVGETLTSSTLHAAYLECFGEVASRLTKKDILNNKFKAMLWLQL